HLDSHLNARLDNYMESCLAELYETLRIAKAAKVDYYILLGDVFNRITVGGECRNRAIDILLSDNEEPWPFKKYVVPGNHDYAHNPLYLDKSDLGALIAADAVENITEMDDLPVSFYAFTPKLDQQLKDGEFLPYDPSKIIF